jgi:RNA polymerase sigma-70 factor (ECF subfamily)
MIATEHNYLIYVEHMDDISFRSLMEAYGEEVWGYAYSITRNTHQADDIAQDVFLKAYTKIADFRGESSVKTWLLTITRNLAYNVRKSAFIRRVTLVDVVRGSGSQNSAESQYLDQSYTDDLWNIVMNLPAKYREVLQLDARHQLSGKEMSSLLGISEGTVKSRLHRARQSVTKSLKEAVDDENV